MGGEQELLSALDQELARLRVLLPQNPPLAYAELLALLERAQALDAIPQTALIEVLLAGAAFLRGFYDDMLKHAQAALSISRRHRLGLLEARALNNIGLAHQRMGDMIQAMGFLLESFKVAEANDDKEGCCRAMLNTALVHSSLGEHEMALNLHEQALEVARACNQPAFVADAMLSLVMDHAELGHYGYALELAEETGRFLEDHPLMRFRGALASHQAGILLALGRPEEAARVVERGLEIASTSQDQETLASLLQQRGCIQLALGDLDDAEKNLQQGLALSKKLRLNEVEHSSHAALAELYERKGDFQQAYGHLQTERQMVEERLSAEAKWRTQQIAVNTHVELQRSLTLANLQELGGPTRSSIRDALTGVVGRPYFQSRVQKALELLAPEEHLGLVFVSIDHMRSINENYGEETGDAVLVEMAHRLRESLRSSDLVGRVSGDEFMVLLGQLAFPEDLALVMDKLLSNMRQPLNVSAHPSLNVTVSLGGVVAPEDGSSIALLYRHADLALQNVKSQGRNGAVRFMPHMSAEEQRRRNLEFDLRGAAARGELCLYYQPQYSLPQRQLIGFEALVRWQHPKLGLIPPMQFIPLAEESRLILEVGNWVLHEACRQAAEWHFSERRLCMSVNISALQFEQPDFVAQIQSLLGQYGLNGENLALELTESMVQRDQAHAADSIQRLLDLGVRVALDDFGTGYSSLSLLQNLPFHLLKVDRSFLNDLLYSSSHFNRAFTLLEVVMKLAHNLNMRVVAEGIEQEEQYELLCRLNCHSAQGYWFARPLPAEAAAELL